MESFKKYVCEAVGTLFLVFFGCGAACLTGAVPGSIGYLLTALAFGGAVVAMAYSVGNYSGGHFNPAVSVAMLMMRRMSLIDCVGYVAAQCVGAICGSGLLFVLFDGNSLADKTGNLGANAVNKDAGGVAIALFVEVILTFAFVLTVLGATGRKDGKGGAAVVCGGALTLVHLFGIAFTGTSVNPARSLAPALFARGTALTDLWIFIVAPVIGAVLAALFQMFFEKGKSKPKSADSQEK